MSEEQSRITVGELKEQLGMYSDDTEITFGNTLDAVPLVFYWVKTRGDKLAQIELNELRPEVTKGTKPSKTKSGCWFSKSFMTCSRRPNQRWHARAVTRPSLLAAADQRAS